MNREIKFRAWDKKFNTMFPTECIEFYGWGQINIIDEEGDSEERDVVLMQYTGLKDKNGKEIYEGDVVRFKYTPSSLTKAIIEYDEESIAFKLEVKESEEWCKHSCYLEPRCQIEVIGNIYENPNLVI